jgi:hypothetical protein
MIKKSIVGSVLLLAIGSLWASTRSGLLIMPSTTPLGVDLQADLDRGIQATATPDALSVNTSTRIKITATINDFDDVVPNSVQLFRLQPGLRLDFGTSIDRLKPIGDNHTFAINIELNEQTTGTIQFVVIAKFKGRPHNSVSTPISVLVYNPQGATPNDIANDSPIILSGSVVSLNSHLNMSGTDAVTDINISIIKIFKGQLSTNQIVVEVPGGTLGNIVADMPGIPNFSSGENVVLLLAGPDSTGHYSIPDNALGAFHIRSNPQGGDIAIVDSEYLELETTRARTPEFQSFLAKSAAGNLSLAELLTTLGISQ